MRRATFPGPAATSFTGVTSGEPTLVGTTPNAGCVATGITLK